MDDLEQQMNVKTIHPDDWGLFSSQYIMVRPTLNGEEKQIVKRYKSLKSISWDEIYKKKGTEKGSLNCSFSFYVHTL